MPARKKAGIFRIIAPVSAAEYCTEIRDPDTSIIKIEFAVIQMIRQAEFVPRIHE